MSAVGSGAQTRVEELEEAARGGYVAPLRASLATRADASASSWLGITSHLGDCVLALPGQARGRDVPQCRTLGVAVD